MKLIGTVLIGLSAVIFGFASSHRLDASNRIRASLILLLREIKSGIALSKPLEKIYASFYNAYLDRIGFLEILNAGGDKPLCRAVKESRSVRLLTAEEYDALMFFSERVGLWGNCDTEAAKVGELLSLLEDRRRELEKVTKQKSALSVKLGVLAAAAVLIVML